MGWGVVDRFNYGRFHRGSPWFRASGSSIIFNLFRGAMAQGEFNGHARFDLDGYEPTDGCTGRLKVGKDRIVACWKSSNLKLATDLLRRRWRRVGSRSWCRILDILNGGIIKTVASADALSRHIDIA
jgi:hypothetical protein